MSIVRIGVAGGFGRMGRAVREAVDRDARCELVAVLVSLHSRDLAKGEQSKSPVPVVDDPCDFVRNVDVVVDFSMAEVVSNVAAACAAQGVAFVSGTTALQPEHHAALDQAAGRIPVLWAPNMSLGISAIMAALPGITKALNGYDVEIVESHHRHKRDAPSGTTLALARRISEQGDRSAVELHSIRAGSNPGTHTLVFGGDGDEVTITHRAFGRECYAQGALAAARFVVEKPPGRYTMADVIAAVAV